MTERLTPAMTARQFVDDMSFRLRDSSAISDEVASSVMIAAGLFAIADAIRESSPEEHPIDKAIRERAAREAR